MSAVILNPTLPTVSRVTWAQPEGGFYVASRAGEFVGYVDTTADGHFIAFDGRSTPVGRYARLAEAKRAAVTANGRRRRTPLHGIDRRLHAAAAASGAIAAVLFAAAGTVVVPYL
ncbi:peptide ABC transporter permease [Microbacterium sp. NPDC019599]|uniref:peptide ABC transporter permease n=1 Tax=Microbacterium sp. NPDC019599 TaxID=3154690 RepID=UPI0033E2BDCA